jgi:malonate-semialdehyde dehydrogenase (acetylating)/methylmalonate-semialdehyde dehydrogenase
MKTERVADNLIGGEFVSPQSGEYLDVVNPASGDVIGKVGVSTAADVERAIAQGREAFKEWRRTTVKTRAAIMLRFHALMMQHQDELADIVVQENGKNKMEALASVLKGNETVEYACSLPQLVQGRTLAVSRGITCQEVRDPLGVVACVVPFNFPIMVPMWTIPIALTMGNCVILKPSEKVPLTMARVAELLIEAGVPKGVFQVSSNSICHHSSPISSSLHAAGVGYQWNSGSGQHLVRPPGHRGADVRWFQPRRAARFAPVPRTRQARACIGRSQEPPGRFA